jgi:hypothetical protein
LQAQVGEGKRMKAVEVYKPTYHGDGRADWTFLVVVTYANADASLESSHDQSIIQRLFPDQDKYRKEEARRFELLDAHWDVPLTAVSAPDATLRHRASWTHFVGAGIGLFGGRLSRRSEQGWAPSRA